MEFFNNINLEAFGWISALCFSLSPLPQVVKCIKEGHANGMSWGLILLWLLGELAAITYVFPKQDIPLLANYFLNLIWLSIILNYKIKGGSSHEKR